MTPSGERSVKRGCLGCLGMGGLGLLAFYVVFSALAAQVPSCDLDLAAVSKDPPGSHSARLPVTVSPRTGLTAGQVVRVRSKAFDARSVVGVAVCLRKADTEHRGLDACETQSASRYAVDARGQLDAHFTLPRTITIGTRTYDCAGRLRRCLVVAAAADFSVFGDDYDRSGGQTIEFRTDLPPVPLIPTAPRPATRLLPVVGSPSGPVPADTDVEVLATGFEPGEPVTVAWCHDVEHATSAAEACEVLDHDALDGIVYGDLPSVGLRADATGQVRTKASARARIVPFGDALGAALELADEKVRPTVTTPGAPRQAVDCRAQAARCSIVVTALADTQRSAVLPYELVPK